MVLNRERLDDRRGLFEVQFPAVFQALRCGGFHGVCWLVRWVGCLQLHSSLPGPNACSAFHHSPTTRESSSRWAVPNGSAASVSAAARDEVEPRQNKSGASLNRKRRVMFMGIVRKNFAPQSTGTQGSSIVERKVTSQRQAGRQKNWCQKDEIRVPIFLPPIFLSAKNRDGTW